MKEQTKEQKENKATKEKESGLRRFNLNDLILPE